MLQRVPTGYGKCCHCILNICNGYDVFRYGSSKSFAKKKKKLMTERHSLNYQLAELKATDVVDSFRLLQILLSLHEYTIL